MFTLQSSPGSNCSESFRQVGILISQLCKGRETILVTEFIVRFLLVCYLIHVVWMLQRDYSNQGPLEENRRIQTMHVYIYNKFEFLSIGFQTANVLVRTTENTDILCLYFYIFLLMLYYYKLQSTSSIY